MVRIFFYNFADKEEIPTNTAMTYQYINNIKLNEKIVIKGIIYNVSDVRYNFDEDTIRFGLIREGIAR